MLSAGVFRKARSLLAAATHSSPALGMIAACGLLLLCLSACSGQDDSRQPCVEDGRVLKVGFHVFYPPVSYNADTDPAAPGFGAHLGYEADILTALEAMDGRGLSFSRHPLPEWEGIWLQSATPDYDVIGGGITIRDTRTRDASGETVVVFTSGHITFRQSLLVRIEDADRLATYGDLTGEVTVGAFRGTTNESRLLQLTGLTDSEGVLAEGVRVDTPQGTVTPTAARTTSSPPLQSRPV